MKFIVKNLSKCSPRTGIMESIKRLPGTTFETPMPFIYTKGGSIPSLSREVIDLISLGPQCLQIPLVSTSTFFESLSEYEATIGDFVGLKDFLSYVTIQDAAENTPAGHHLQNNIPIWTRSGKTYLNSESYMDIIESFKPDMYCMLSDGDTNRTSSKKRITKSVDQTISFFDKCIERHLTSEKLKSSNIIAAVEGGYCIKSRERCISGLAKHSKNISGYLIDGLHNNGAEVELLSFDEIKEIVEKTISQLPEDKLRIIHGCWNPLVIIKLVTLGIDLFDTSYLQIVAERRAALTFNFEPIAKDNLQHIYEINFDDSKYADDFSPILRGCVCFTCKKYTKAYIHHLFNVQELLGPILLNIHNIHHYLQFFQTIRTAIKCNTLENLEHLIKSQYNEHQAKIKSKTISSDQQIKSDENIAID